MDPTSVVRALFERAWNHGDVGALADHVGERVAYHWRGATTTTDLEGLGQLVAAWRGAFPDLTFDVHQVVAEGDTVAARLTYTGTHRGPWKGRAATGRRIRVDEMLFARFDDGVLVEVWEVEDELVLLQQLDGEA